ncbi:MAG: hypothetical protein K5841_00815 [Fretibacterium sp.]|nr:hypothetical protein [Fretibacterium sp.]
MIESFIEGRLRLRSPLLKDKELTAFLSARLLAMDGVTKAEANPRTRGLLLEYDKDLLPLERVKRAAPMLERLSALEKLPAPQRRPALSSLLDELKAMLLE